ncbi:hypothetical protein DYST_01892 [Dyella terrae]|nr:hypothetical protein [Dyella terrae]ULU24972.1 hypothetical protein DYST_01892 [Dyella terrae]
MKVEVGCLLPTKDPVVLKREYAEGLIRFDQRLRDTFCRDHNRLAFLKREVEQRSDMPTRDDATLADFELQWIYHRERMLALIDDRPSFFATCRFTKVTRISYGKLDQWASPMLPNYGNDTAQCKGYRVRLRDRHIPEASD